MSGKIDSMKNHAWFKPAAFIVATLAIVFLPLIFYRPATNTLVLDGQEYTLEIVVSAEERQTGLSGRETIAANEGMLFVEPKPKIVCMWMKDMSFAIDIIWLDDKKIIRHLEERVSPKTYPKSFCPSVKTKYVIELPSGTIDKHELVLGQKLPLQ
jgi:uncharacterized protein